MPATCNRPHAPRQFPNKGYYLALPNAAGFGWDGCIFFCNFSVLVDWSLYLGPFHIIILIASHLVVGLSVLSTCWLPTHCCTFPPVPSQPGQSLVWLAVEILLSLGSGLCMCPDAVAPYSSFLFSATFLTYWLWDNCILPPVRLWSSLVLGLVYSPAPAGYKVERCLSHLTFL